MDQAVAAIIDEYRRCLSDAAIAAYVELVRQGLDDEAIRVLLDLEPFPVQGTAIAEPAAA